MIHESRVMYQKRETMFQLKMHHCHDIYTPMRLFGSNHTALRRISILRGEALASTTSFPVSLEMTGFSTIVAFLCNCP